MELMRLAVLLTLLVLLPAGTMVAEVGEFCIPATAPLNTDQLKRLRTLVNTNAEAKALAAEVKKTALPLLDAKPHPLKVIHYEGLVNTDPRRIATVKKLKEMGDVAHVVRYWQVSGDPKAGSMLKRFILAWTGTYELTGNDVNENKFVPLLIAYEALREDFPGDQRKRIDAWIEGLGTLHHKAVRKSKHFTNRYTKHVRLLALCGIILEKNKWVAEAHKGIRRFVSESLYPDGTSRDLKHRDTLSYHMSSLRPPIELAMLAGADGRNLYTWTSERGGSLKKSVNYVVPYAMGEKTRKEWTKSKVGLDKKRAEAGLEKYRPGSEFKPKSALKLMELAEYFDPELMKVVRHLTQSKTKRFPTWQTLINEAARPNAND
ncbi:MAG: alginate lyase family protein [Phycisphaerae bacterium]